MKIPVFDTVAEFEAWRKREELRRVDAAVVQIRQDLLDKLGIVDDRPSVVEEIAAIRAEMRRLRDELPELVQAIASAMDPEAFDKLLDT